MTSEVDVSVTAGEVDHPTNIPLCFVAMWLMVAEGQSDRRAPDMEVRMKQRSDIEFLSVEKNGIYWHSLMRAESLWRPNSGCEYSEAVSGAL